MSLSDSCRDSRGKCYLLEVNAEPDLGVFEKTHMHHAEVLIRETILAGRK